MSLVVVSLPDKYLRTASLSDQGSIISCKTRGVLLKWSHRSTRILSAFSWGHFVFFPGQRSAAQLSGPRAASHTRQWTGSLKEYCNLKFAGKDQWFSFKQAIHLVTRHRSSWAINSRVYLRQVTFGIPQSLDDAGETRRAMRVCLSRRVAFREVSTCHLGAVTRTRICPCMDFPCISADTRGICSHRVLSPSGTHPLPSFSFVQAASRLHA